MIISVGYRVKSSRGVEFRRSEIIGINHTTEV